MAALAVGSTVGNLAGVEQKTDMSGSRPSPPTGVGWHHAVDGGLVAEWGSGRDRTVLADRRGYNDRFVVETMPGTETSRTLRWSDVRH
jgi:hypothetical protein